MQMSAKAKQEENEKAMLPKNPGVSPGRAIELHMKDHEQLRYVQRLFDDGILYEAEYVELNRNKVYSHN